MAARLVAPARTGLAWEDFRLTDVHGHVVRELIA
jgi:hypothetical protein